MASTPRWFPDVSSNNGPVDVEQVVAGGLPIFAIKATQGTTYANPYHRDQAQRTHLLYTPVLHYHYADPADAVAQAQWFWSAVRPVWRAWDRMALDFEVVAALPRQFVDEFCVELGTLSGSSGILGYTNQSRYVSDRLSGAVPSGRWWIADYGAQPSVSGKDVLYAHQSTDSGQWPGIEGACDLSILNLRSANAYATAKKAREAAAER